MKKLMNMRYFKPITLAVLFVLTSAPLFFMNTLVACFVTGEGRGLITFLSTIMAILLLPLSVCTLWTYWHKNNPINKWRVLRNYSIIVTLVSFLSLALHIVMIVTKFNGHAMAISALFPYDILVLLVSFLAIGIATLVYVIRNRKNVVDSDNTKPEIRTRTVVAAWFMIPFASYYFGGTLFVVNLFTDFDTNWYGMIPVILSLSLLALFTVLFFLYKHGKEEDKQKNYKKGLLIAGITTIVLLAWTLVAVLINSRLFPESLSNFFLLGFAIKIPIGFFINTIGVVVILIITLVRYIKRYVKKK